MSTSHNKYVNPIMLPINKHTVVIVKNDPTVFENLIRIRETERDMMCDICCWKKRMFKVCYQCNNSLCENFICNQFGARSSQWIKISSFNSVKLGHFCILFFEKNDLSLLDSCQFSITINDKSMFICFSLIKS